MKKTLWILALIILFCILVSKAHGDPLPSPIKPAYAYQLASTTDPSPIGESVVDGTYISPPIVKKVSSPNSRVALNLILGEKIALEENMNWECLYKLGMAESGWDERRVNTSSGAFGIPQALPAKKLDTYGDRYDPEVQIRWMIDYIERVYKTSCNAYQTQQLRQPHWY